MAINPWLLDRLGQVQRMYAAGSVDIQLSCHFLPQSHFITDAAGQVTCHHILRFEDLTHDFNNLMAQYGMHIKLKLAPADERYRSWLHAAPALNGMSCTEQFKPAELAPEVIQLINTIYADDFALGPVRYTKL